MISYNPNIAYYQISSLMDEDTCPICRKLNGLCILNNKSNLNKINEYENGVEECTNPEGCRCILVGVFKEEVGSDKIVEDLKKAGGVLPKSYFEEKERRRQKKLKSQRKKTDSAYELYKSGRELEKINIAKAIKIYETIIDKYNDIGPTYYLPAFLRLSLCLEKEGKYKDCLRVIKKALKENKRFKFHTFTKADISTLSKRQERCKEKI